MNLELLLRQAAKAAGVEEGVAREAAVQLAKEASVAGPVGKLLEALNAGLPSRWAKTSPEALGCARAALLGLRALRQGDDRRAQWLQLAQDDAKKETEARTRYGEGPWRCGCCGSQRVDDEHTGRGTVRFIQLLCDACGATVDGLDGAPALMKWKAGAP